MGRGVTRDCSIHVTFQSSPRTKNNLCVECDILTFAGRPSMTDRLSSGLLT